MNIKSRHWAFIVYPESALEGWEMVLEEKGTVFAVSPLHDKDITPEGEKKKDHYHVLVEFEGPTTYKNVKENICDVIGSTIPKNIMSVRGYYRYLTHEDNPEKAQYNKEDIKEYNGFHLDLTITETTAIMKKITEDIVKLDIKEYCDLLDYYNDLGDQDYWEICSNHVYFLDKYICSRRNKIKQQKEQEFKMKLDKTKKL